MTKPRNSLGHLDIHIVNVFAAFPRHMQNSRCHLWPSSEIKICLHPHFFLKTFLLLFKLKLPAVCYWPCFCFIYRASLYLLSPVFSYLKVIFHSVYHSAKLTQKKNKDLLFSSSFFPLPSSFSCCFLLLFLSFPFPFALFLK